MNSVVKNVIHHFTSSIEYKIIICYLLVICLFFTARLSGESYISIVLGPFCNYIFTFLAVYIPLIFIYNYTYNYIDNSMSLTIRLKNKRRVDICHALCSLIQTCLFFLVMLLIMMIYANLIRNTGELITYKLNYNYPDIIYFITGFVKIFLSAYFLSLLNIILRKKISDSMSLLIILCVLLINLMTSFVSSSLTIVNILNPGLNSISTLKEANIWKSIGYSLIYYNLIYALALLIINKLNCKLK